MLKFPRIGTAALWLPLVMCCPRVHAQQAPDAGRVLQQNAPALRPPPAAAEAPIEVEPIRPILNAPEGAHLVVQSFRFSGTTVFSAAELGPLLGDWIGRDIGFAELRRASERITRYYRDHGYFVARAYLPAQEIRDGVVEILVIEGRLGKVDIERAASTRLAQDFLDNEIRAAVPPGSVIRQDQLERALLLINDVPGIAARATLSPGTQQATTDLRLDVREGPLLSGELDYDNAGNRFTGEQRPGARLNVDDALGLGEQLRLYYVGLADNEYYNLAFGLPVTAQGLKLGASYTYTNYHLCCDFAPLDATGRARVLEANAAYPLVRSGTLNVNATAAVDRKNFYNATFSGTTSDKFSNVATVGINVDRRDGLFGGGSSYAGIALAIGSLNLDGWTPDRQADALSANAAGSFSKVNLTGIRAQSLDPDWTLYGSLMAQLAGKNLDTSEKISLGGANGVRSYPTNEAIGDSGAILNLELRRRIGSYAEVFGLFDYGYVELHHAVWNGWQGGHPGLANSYGLAGTGAGVGYARSGDFSLRAVVAQRLGSNPGRDLSGNDSDGEHRRTRLWVQAIKYL